MQSKEEVGILSNLKTSWKWSAGQSLVYKSNEITVLASEFGSVVRQWPHYRKEARTGRVTTITCA